MPLIRDELGHRNITLLHTKKARSLVEKTGLSSCSGTYDLCNEVFDILAVTEICNHKRNQTANEEALLGGEFHLGGVGGGTT